MKALLWKDFRINMFVLGLGIVFLLGPPIVFTGVNVYSDLRYSVLALGWPDMLVLVSSYGLAFQLLTVAMLGGVAVAAERADRSAEFLAYLPPSRLVVLTSKAIIAVGASVLIWCAGVAVGYYVAPLVGVVPEGHISFRDALVPNLTAAAVILFGVAWFASTLLSSHALATGVGIAAPVTLLCGLAGVAYFLGSPAFDLAGWYRSLGVVLGVVAFAAGTAYYLRRVEP